MKKTILNLKKGNFDSMKSCFAYIKAVFISVFFAVLLQGCKTFQPLTTNMVDEVALISTTANFQIQPGVNLAAAAARGQFRGASAEINRVMSENVDTLRNFVALNIKAQLGCKLVYGKELHDLPNYKALVKKIGRPDALNKEDKDFNEVFISSGDENFVISKVNTGLLDGGVVVYLNKDEMKETIRNLCNVLNVKYIAYANFDFSGMRTDLVFPTSTYIYYHLYIYNKDGDCVAGNDIGGPAFKLPPYYKYTVSVQQANMPESYLKMLNSFYETIQSIKIYNFKK